MIRARASSPEPSTPAGVSERRSRDPALGTGDAAAGMLAEPPSGPGLAGGVQETITVLVADDEAALRTAASRVLRAGGYKVIEAANGEEALALAAAWPGRIDVLLTDVVMPGVGGVELVARISAIDPTIRVVYMSGYPQSHLEAMGGLAGGHAFVDKPFGLDALLAAVQGALTVGA